MTLSVWRYAHLALAISSFIFLALASITGVVLGIDAVKERATSYQSDHLNRINLSGALVSLKEVYPEITEISIDHNQVVTIQAIDKDGNDINACINPSTGKILGYPKKKSAFILWTTAFHRSLFLHEAGRFFVGLISFLLFLITCTGTVLIIQRQHSLRRFFSKIIKENFSQYYHVVTGRLFLAPIIVVALTGTYLSMARFNLLPTNPIETKDFDDRAEEFGVFKTTPLSEVRKLEFPFSDDPEEVYVLKLKDRELRIDQVDGSIISEVRYPWTMLVETISMDLHTGRTSVIWAIVISIASLNILLFIWSGFTITLRRIAVKTKNKFRADQAEYVLLVGSENGTTMRFANAIHQQLIAAKQASFITELNNYQLFPASKHIVIFTSTYGLGDPPSDARKFMTQLEKHSQQQKVNVSVVGFGSRAYPDFCKYAEDINEHLKSKSWSKMLLPLHTVNDKSLSDFATWVKHWSEQVQLPLVTTPAFYNESPMSLAEMVVTEKTPIGADQTFIMKLRPVSKTKFTSGDLLAIHPANDGRERFYSIGKMDDEIQLVVKFYPSGLGSEYLFALETGSTFEARIVRNPEFHFPSKAPEVMMISNGTGIAPFLGMMDENRKTVISHLYCGFRNRTEITNRYQAAADEFVQKNYLANFHVAFSREEQSCYVMDLLERDATHVSGMLSKGGVIMICGSLAMQQSVEKTIDIICIERSNYNLEHFKSKGQILTDCY